MILPTIARSLLSIAQLLLALSLAYYYLLLGAGRSRRRSEQPEEDRQRRFAIAIPAHNEQAVIARTVAALQAQDYPRPLFDVHVAADYCDDHTARAAREQGAIAHERRQGPRGRKAYPLQWLLARILQDRSYDAVVVFDADSRVAPDFLSTINAALDPEHRVLQGQHLIAPGRSGRFGALADVDMRLNNLLRNQAKRNLGLSGRLMGDAMCFGSEILRRYGWPTDSLTEDREYGLYLLTRGLRVHYVPAARSFGQAAPGWKEASRQRLRWYGGVGQIQRRFALPLLRQALRRADWAALDQALELLLPSLSTSALLSLAVAGLQALWPSLRPLLPLPVSIGFLLAWGLFPFLGLWQARAPAASFRALFYSPVYILWRLWMGLLARLRRGRIAWVRTRRQEE